MKNHLFSKAVSLTAAAAIGCTSMIGSAGINALAFPQSAPQAAVLSSKEVSAEAVNVIVTVKGDAVLADAQAAELGKSYLDTAEAEVRKQEIRQAQDAVLQDIRRIYPELEVRFRYDLVCNGFACKLPENLIDAVKALPDVDSVCAEHPVSTPKMATALNFSNYPQFFDTTGSCGAGQVIAVIDGEFNVDHPMFSALDESVETALKKEDIDKIIKSGELSIPADAAYAYRSSKVPFAVDYIGDAYEGIAVSDGLDHGTHVAGIAAGNAFQDSAGTTISGIAKDAQLILMATGMPDGTIDYAAVLAAAEDALKLHADVINLSIGIDADELFEINEFDKLYIDTFKTLENAGIVVCKSAGNADDGSSSGIVNRADMPDRSMLGDSPNGSAALIVASADNNVVQRLGTLKLGEQTITAGLGFPNNYNTTLTSTLSGDYEYEYCGYGLPEDFYGRDLTGKIALVDRGKNGYDEKANNAAEAGAVGLIVINYNKNNDPLGAPLADIPIAHISFEDGKMLRQDQKKIITVISGETQLPQERKTVSSFSSWGVKEDLETYPDIMGVGGQIESAYNKDSTDVMQGTSMSSPYVAGCVAVVEEYLKKHGKLDMTGRDKVLYVNNLLMNSATLYKNGDLYASPRQQGAGLVNLNDLLADKVILTGEEGKAKINLHDKLGDSFDFTVNITNLGDEEVKFSSAKLVLTTDGSEYSEEKESYLISGQTALTCTADVSALLTAAPGETRKEKISVSLDPAQTAEIAKAFVNGFFVEGYLVLEGAENCCDVSIPVLGFHGDWNKLPATGSARIRNSASDSCIIDNDISYATMLQLLRDADASIPPEEILPDGSNYIDLLMEHVTPEMIKEAEKTCRDVGYVSPNGDGLGDIIGIDPRLKRSAMLKGLMIKDTDGKILKDAGWYYVPKDMGTTGSMFTDESIEDLPEGRYIAALEGYINYPGSEEDPFTIELPFEIDNTAPELKTDLTEKDGRKYLTITASDKCLDGVYIVGSGKGGVVGSYDPANPTEHPIWDMEVFTLVQPLLNSEELNLYSSTFRPDGRSAVETAIANGYPDYEQLSGCDFFDFMYAETDENGVYTVTYDVTDLTAYSITALDRAFNASTVASNIALAEAITPGVYQNIDALTAFTDSTMTVRDFITGKDTVYDYTLENGQMKLTHDGKTDAVTVEQPTPSVLRLTFADGKVVELHYLAEGTVNDFHFFSGEAIAEQFLEDQSTAFEISHVEYQTEPNDTTALSLFFKDEQGEEQLLTTLYFNRFTGEATLASGSTLNVSGQPIDLHSGGFWVSEDGRYYVFDTESDSGYFLLQKDGSKHSFTYTETADSLTLTIEGKTEEYMYWYDNSEHFILYEDGSEDPFQNTVFHVPADLTTLRFYTNTELQKLAADYYKEKTGKTPAEVTVSDGFMTGTSNVTISFGEGEIYYRVNSQDGIGTDTYGNPVNLTEKLEAMADPFRKGIYKAMSSTEPVYYCFHGDGTGECFGLMSEKTEKFTYTMKPYGCEIKIGRKRARNVYLYDLGDGSVLLDWNDYTKGMETLRFESEGDFETVKIYKQEDVLGMAEIDLTKATGAVPAAMDASVDENGNIIAVLSDDKGKILDVYTIDPLTGKGTNMSGAAVDLPHTGIQAPGAAAGTAAAAAAAAAGFFLMLKSGFFRRKKTKDQV